MHRIFTPLLPLLFATPLTAETRSLGAHEHGTGALNIAVDGDTLALELRVPGADIVGFEYAASSAEDKAAIKAALAQLEQPNNLFLLGDAAGCSLEMAHAELVTEGTDGHDDHGDDEHGHDDHADHDEHGDDEHGHDDHADHDEHAHDEHAHDDHGHDDHADHATEAQHSEFTAEYSFSCNNMDALAAINLSYFALFPNAQALDVQIVSEAGATAVETDRDMTIIDLKGAN